MSSRVKVMSEEHPRVRGKTMSGLQHHDMIQEHPRVRGENLPVLKYCAP